MTFHDNIFSHVFPWLCEPCDSSNNKHTRRITNKLYPYMLCGGLLKYDNNYQHDSFIRQLIYLWNILFMTPSIKIDSKISYFGADFFKHVWCFVLLLNLQILITQDLQIETSHVSKNLPQSKKIYYQLTNCLLRISRIVSHSYLPSHPPFFSFMYLYRGCASSPFTLIFANMSNFTPYFSVANALISAFVPGSCRMKQWII